MGKDTPGRRNFSNPGKELPRKSMPPPVPGAAKSPSPLPPHVAIPACSPPPLPDSRGQETEGNTTPRGIFPDQARLQKLLISFYPEEPNRLQVNGNPKPVLQHHLKAQKDCIMLEIESHTTLFSRIPVKYAAIAAIAIALAAGGAAIHSCSEAKESWRQLQETKQKLREIERKLETPEPKKTSFLPRCLINPPKKPIQKMLPKRRPIRRTV
jgi:hypothetical protein